MTPLVATPPEAVTPTRAVASLVISERSFRQDQQTEETADRHIWPTGINYSSVTVPQPAPRDAFLDPLDVLELLDD
jgi:hypothetical protein